MAATTEGTVVASTADVQASMATGAATVVTVVARLADSTATQAAVGSVVLEEEAAFAVAVEAIANDVSATHHKNRQQTIAAGFCSFTLRRTFPRHHKSNAPSRILETGL